MTTFIIFACSSEGVAARLYVRYVRYVHVRYVESTSLDDVPFWQLTQGDTRGDACWYHNWDGKVPNFGNWLGDGVREIILEA